MRVVTRDRMRQIEQNSLRYDMTLHRLMENAGSAAAAFIRRTFQVQGLGCMVFCGAGNNGGDGLVVARKLAENGADVLVVLVDGEPRGDDAASMYATAEMMELPIADFLRDRQRILDYLPGIDIVVDAIYGTGFRGSLDETHAAACELINAAIAAVVALDTPTGVECDSGHTDKSAVTADFTVAFDSLKPLHVLPQSAAFCGKVEPVDIGVPEAAREGLALEVGSFDIPQVLACLPPRAADSHKGDYGTVLNIAGSLRYRGAAVLSTLGALRCGAGIVTLASIEPVCAAVCVHAPEATLLPLPETTEGGIAFSAFPSALTAALENASAVLVGCGLQNTAEAARLLEWVLENAPCPVVIDADGINALCGNIHVLQKAKNPVILTPHPGEMARLCGVEVADIQHNRFGAAARFAAEHKVVVLLKGAQTLCALPDGKLYINTTGNPGLAKGGSGDVLAGMLAALLAQGVPSGEAAACAAYLHGLAADRACARLSQRAMLPHELLWDVGQIFLENGR